MREFAQREVRPVIKEYDRKQEMVAFILPRMAELGILWMCLPVRYGGQEMDYSALGLACEELEAVDSTLRVVLNNLAAPGILPAIRLKQTERFWQNRFTWISRADQRFCC